MDSDRWQNSTSIFLLGLGIGAAVGILLAPRSGERTRRRISKAVNDGTDNLVDHGVRLGRRAQKTVESAKAQIRDAAEAGEKAFREVKKVVS